MTEPQETPAQEAQIDAFQAAKAAYRKARLIGLLLILAPIVVFTFLGWRMVTHFIDHDVDVLLGHLQEEVVHGELTENVKKRLQRSFDRLLPLYRETLLTSLEENQDAWLMAMDQEVEATRRHGEEAMPLIEDSIAMALAGIEEMVREELGKFIEPDALADIATRILTALDDQLTEFYSAHFLFEREPIAEGIVDKLVALAESEPRLEDDDTVSLIGMILELIGLEIQAYAASLENL